MQLRRLRRTTDADQRQQLQHDLAEGEQHEGAADKDLGRERREREHGAAEFSHVPIGAEQDDQLEEERHGDQAERLDQPQRTRAAEQRRQPAADIDAIGDRRIRDVEPQRIRPRTRQLPEGEQVIALIGEQREHGGVDQHRLGRQRAENRASP